MHCLSADAPRGRCATEGGDESAGVKGIKRRKIDPLAVCAEQAVVKWVISTETSGINPRQTEARAPEAIAPNPEPPVLVTMTRRHLRGRRRDKSAVPEPTLIAVPTGTGTRIEPCSSHRHDVCGSGLVNSACCTQEENRCTVSCSPLPRFHAAGGAERARAATRVVFPRIIFAINRYANRTVTMAPYSNGSRMSDFTSQ
jgi:hypothetical protein